VCAEDETVTAPLLVELYRQLPQRRSEDGEVWVVRFHSALNAFKKKLLSRYSEGTLQRLLGSPDDETRRAAVLSLGLVGGMASSRLLAALLHDEDDRVRELVSNALWALWFRADSEDNNQELQRLMRLKNRGKALAGLDTLLDRAPAFAEAYNQRAILFYQMKYYDRSIADCERTLSLNPQHFGAQCGMAQCYLQLGRQRAALKAFRQALKMNPDLPGVAETIRALEEALDNGDK
jgi:tetratricopeptide (TPR) repeat protein